MLAQSVLPALSGALGGLPGSLLCLPPGSGSSSFLGSLWFWLGVSAPFYAGPQLGLSSSPWLFHYFWPPVSSVLLSSTLVFSVTLPVGSSWAPLSRCCFLSCSSGLPVRQSPSCIVLELFSRLLVLSPAVVPGSLIPLRCLMFRSLVTVPVWSQGFLYLSR